MGSCLAASRANLPTGDGDAPSDLHACFPSGQVGSRPFPTFVSCTRVTLRGRDVAASALLGMLPEHTGFLPTCA